MVIRSKKMREELVDRLGYWDLLLVILLWAYPAKAALHQSHALHQLKWKTTRPQVAVCGSTKMQMHKPPVANTPTKRVPSHDIQGKGFWAAPTSTLPFQALVRSPYSQEGGELTNKTKSSSTRATAVYALIMVNFGVFLADNVLRKSFVLVELYLFHFDWEWWQTLTSCFCHSGWKHLSSNMLLLLLFGRSTEDDWGWDGLLLSYAFCGVISNLIALLLLPATTVSTGASGSVLGLIAVSTLAKLRWRDALDWRKWVELSVLASAVSNTAGVGQMGINHAARSLGAAVGAVIVLGMRAIVVKLKRTKRELRFNKPARYPKKEDYLEYM